MDDDDWGLSFEELDLLERNAAIQLAKRHKSSATAAPKEWCSPKKASSGSPSRNVASGPFCDVAGSPSKIATLSPTSKKSLKVRIFKDQAGRIAVESPYHPDLVIALRTVSGKSWDQARRVWTYPESGLEDVVKAITSVSKLHVTIDAEPPLSTLPSVEGTERNVLRQDKVQMLSTPPPSQGNPSHELVLPLINPPPDCFQPQSSVDGGWMCPKSGKAQLSQSEDVSQRLPLRKCTVCLCLHSSGKVAAKCEYDSQVVASLRKIPKAEWNAKERLWMFPASSLAEAEKTLGSVPDRCVRVEPLIPIVKRALEATVKLPDLQDKYECVPEELKRTLMDFQVDGVRFALQRGGRALIADEMGLGKTLQALAVVSCLKDDWPVLVVVPSSLRVHWATMLKKWLQICPSDITIVMSQGSSREGFDIVRTTGKHQVHLNGQFNIVSYDILSKLEETIMKANFKIVIADESHYMKNPNAKRTNACVPVLQNARFALLLTGTPALSRPIELFKQLQALQPSVYQKVDEYGRRYCMGGYYGLYQGSSNKEELHALVKSTVMIRRLKKDVMTQLPKKRREQVFISLEDRGLGIIRALFHELEAAKKEHRAAVGGKETDEVNRLNIVERQLLAQIYTESAEAKLPAVQDYLATVLEAGCKFLVFGHHQNMLDGIQDLLLKKKANFIRIDGKTPAGCRQELVNKFQEKPDVTVALLGIRAAGVGLTLTAASTVIFAEMTWTPGDLIQAEDRVHRIGQESAVNVYYLHAHESIDDLIWDAVQHKLENLGQVLDGEDDSSMKVTSNEHGREKSLQQASRDPFLRPCSAGRSNVAEINSQAQSSLDSFLRPFEIPPADGSRADVAEAVRTWSADGTRDGNKRKQGIHHGAALDSQPAREMIDLTCPPGECVNFASEVFSDNNSRLGECNSHGRQFS